MQNVTVTLYGVEKRRIPTKKMDFQHTLKEREKERERIAIYQRKCEDKKRKRE